MCSVASSDKIGYLTSFQLRESVGGIFAFLRVALSVGIFLNVI